MFQLMVAYCQAVIKIFVYIYLHYIYISLIELYYIEYYGFVKLLVFTVEYSTGTNYIKKWIFRKREEMLTRVLQRYLPFPLMAIGQSTL